MSTVRTGKRLEVYLTDEQFNDIAARATAQDITVANYVRQLLGFPVEHQGARKDLPAKVKKEKGARGRPRKQVNV